MQIPKRLQEIGNLISDGSYVADVGADHGLLEFYLSKKRKDCHILAIENKNGPFNALNLATRDLENVEVSLSDGIDEVSNKYDTIVLAGMGGDNIIKILTKNKEKLINIKQIIVDAHSFIPKVREAIINFGFDINFEKLVFEKDQFYIIISFLKNEKLKKYTKDEIDFGYKLYLDPLYKTYKDKVLNQLNSVKEKILEAKSEENKVNSINEEIRRFESYGQN